MGVTVHGFPFLRGWGRGLNQSAGGGLGQLRGDTRRGQGLTHPLATCYHWVESKCREWQPDDLTTRPGPSSALYLVGEKKGGNSSLRITISVDNLIWTSPAFGTHRWHLGVLAPPGSSNPCGRPQKWGRWAGQGSGGLFANKEMEHLSYLPCLRCKRGNLPP